jgi:hypothetical protein
MPNAWAEGDDQLEGGQEQERVNQSRGFSSDRPANKEKK